MSVNTARLGGQQPKLGWACQCIHTHGPDKGYHIIWPVITTERIQVGKIPDGMEIVAGYSFEDGLDRVTCAACGQVQPLAHPISHRESRSWQQAKFSRRVGDSVYGFHTDLFHPTMRAQRDKETGRISLDQVARGARLLYVATEGPEDTVAGADPDSYAGFACPPKEQWQGSVRYYEFPRKTFGGPVADGLAGRFVHSVVVQWDADAGEVVSAGPEAKTVLAYISTQDGEPPAWQTVGANAPLPLGTPVFESETPWMSIMGPEGLIDPHLTLNKSVGEEDEAVVFNTIPPSPSEEIWAEFEPAIEYKAMEAQLKLLRTAMAQILARAAAAAEEARKRADAQPHVDSRILEVLDLADEAILAGQPYPLTQNGLTEAEKLVYRKSIEAQQAHDRNRGLRQEIRNLEAWLHTTRSDLAAALEDGRSARADHRKTFSAWRKANNLADFRGNLAQAATVVAAILAILIVVIVPRLRQITASQQREIASQEGMLGDWVLNEQDWLTERTQLQKDLTDCEARSECPACEPCPEPATVYLTEEGFAGVVLTEGEAPLYAAGCNARYITETLSGGSLPVGYPPGYADRVELWECLDKDGNPIPKTYMVVWDPPTVPGKPEETPWTRVVVEGQVGSEKASYNPGPGWLDIWVKEGKLWFSTH